MNDLEEWRKRPISWRSGAGAMDSQKKKKTDCANLYLLTNRYSTCTPAWGLGMLRVLSKDHRGGWSPKEGQLSSKFFLRLTLESGSNFCTN